MLRAQIAQLQADLAACKASAEALAATLDSIGDPVFVKDAGHRLVLVNKAECELAGRPREDLIGRTDYDFFPKEQVDVFWQKDDAVLATGQESLNEETITEASGRVRTIVTRKRLHVDSSGRKFIDVFACVMTSSLI